MGNPTSTITITIEALTEQANAKITSFFNKLNAEAKVGNAGVASSAAAMASAIDSAAKKSAASVGGMSYYFRSAIDGIRLAFAGGGARAGFYALDEAVRGLVSSGLGLWTIAGAVGALAPSIMTATFAWQAFKAGMEEAESESEVFANTIKLEERNLAALHDAFAKGLVSIQDYIHIQSLLVISTPTALAAAQKRMSQLGIAPKQIEEFEKLQKLEREMAESVMERFDQERAKAADVYNERLKQIADLAGKSKMAANARSADEQSASDAYGAALKNIGDREQIEKAQKAIENFQQWQSDNESAGSEERVGISADEYTKRRQFIQHLYDLYPAAEDEITKFALASSLERSRAINEETQALRKLLEIKEQMSKKDYDSDKKSIQDNPFLTDAQKVQQLLSKNANQIFDVSGDLARNMATPMPANEQGQIQLLEQRKQLQADLNGLIGEQQKLQLEAGTSFKLSFGAMFASMKNEAAINFNTLAHTFQDVFNSAISSISNGITKLIMGTENWRRALMEIGQSILTTLVQAIVNLAVRWIATQIVMAVAGKAILAAATAATAPIAAAASAIWAAPATLATIATYGGAALSAPGFISLAEGLTMASALSGFREGGFTGAGGRDEVAGVVHRGEFVVPAERVNQLGLGFLQSMHSGRFAASDFNASSAPSASAAQPGQGGGTIQNHTHVDIGIFDNEAAAKKWAEGEGGTKWFLSMLDGHLYKYQG